MLRTGVCSDEDSDDILDAMVDGEEDPVFHTGIGEVPVQPEYMPSEMSSIDLRNIIIKSNVAETPRRHM